MKPLDGARIATTGTRDPRDPLADSLTELGAGVRRWATLRFHPPEDSDAVRSAVERLGPGSWVVVTSRRAVQALVEVGTRPAAVRVAAVGAGTGAALRDMGWEPTLVGGGGARSLGEEMASVENLSGTPVVFLAGSLAGRELQDILTAAGAQVERVATYRTQIVEPDPGQVIADVEAGVDLVTFLSPSAVEGLAASLGASWPDALRACRTVAIGPTTAGALQESGARVSMTAARPSVRAMVQACVFLHCQKATA